MSRWCSDSVQTATLSAGGLALALATLSLEGEDRARYVPPLVAARSAALLARLSQLPEAHEAMARAGVVDRIIQVRDIFLRLRTCELIFLCQGMRFPSSALMMLQ